MAKQDKEKAVPLFRVFIQGTDRLAYLPSAAAGLPRAEADRLSSIISISTEVRQTFDPEG